MLLAVSVVQIMKFILQGVALFSGVRVHVLMKMSLVSRL